VCVLSLLTFHIISVVLMLMLPGPLKQPSRFLFRAYLAIFFPGDDCNEGMFTLSLPEHVTYLLDCNCLVVSNIEF